MSESNQIRLSDFSNKTLIINAYQLDPTVHKRTLAEHVVGCSYEYVRRLFADLSQDELSKDEVEAALDEDVQRELARQLLVHGVEIETDLEIDVDELETDTIPPAKMAGYVVSAERVADVRDAMADTRRLMANMDEDAGEAVATMAVEKLENLLQKAHPK